MKIECPYCNLWREYKPGELIPIRIEHQGQSKKHSLLEVSCSTAFGYIIALLAQYLVFPLFNIQTSHSDNILIALIFTVISIIRSYIFRRIFNSLCK